MNPDGYCTSTAHSHPSVTTRTERGAGLDLTGICFGSLVLFDATAVNVATGVVPQFPIRTGDP